jgi:hypothetical protein
MVVGAPITDTVFLGGFNTYAVSVIPGTLYKISITGLTDDADLLVFGTDSTFRVLAQCAIDNTAIIGISPEDCVINAPGSTLYFGVDGTFLSTSAAIYTIDVELLTVTNLNPSMPFSDTVTETGAGVYSVSTTTNTAYTVSITGLNDDADLYVFGNNGAFTSLAACSIDNTLFIGTTPEDCTLTSSGGPLYFIVDGIFSSAATVQYTTLATPAPVVPNPANEGSAVTPVNLFADTPVVGQVASGPTGTSYYAASGLIAGTRYTVSIIGLTNGANLIVYDSDNTFATPATCLIDNTFFSKTTPEDCTLVVSGSTLYFKVTADTGSGGVAFINLVEPGP